MEATIENPVLTFIESIESSSSQTIANEADKKEFVSLLEQCSFPTSRTEAWKYTRTNKISKQQFHFNPQTINSVEEFKIPSLETHKIVFVNGYYQAQFSSRTQEDGLQILPFSEAGESEKKELSAEKIQDKDFFAYLNAAFANDGVYIRLKKNQRSQKPVEIIHISTGENSCIQNRNLVVLEENSELEIIHSYYNHSGKNNFSSVQSIFIMGENANLKLEKIQAEKSENFLLCRDQVEQSRNSNFQMNTHCVDGLWLRNDVSVAVCGENATTHLNGAYITKGVQHVDNNTFIDHQVANCESFELYKGVMDDKSTAVFNGKVLVRKDAQRINAYQSNGNVLLSETASVNSKPALEIYADDVKCSHGSTTGQLDEEAIYYLQARGISKKNAQELLVTAYIADVLNKTENDQVREHIHSLLHKRFGWTI